MSFIHKPLQLALAAALFTAMAAQAAEPVAESSRSRSFPALSLPEAGAQGQRALDLLGDRVAEVAAWYRRSPQEFRDMLLRDDAIRLDRNGRLYVVDKLKAPLPARSAEAPGVALAPLSQTFLLNSRPGAQRTIYLDFNGATLTGTAWNSGGNTINAQPFDLDGNPASFSDTELQRIQNIWQRVAEDFAPFEVNVTTQEPPASALSRSGPGDQVYGTTALITNRSGVYNCSCGGVAYLGIFDDTSDFFKPALVFWDALGPGDEKFIAEATSHEVGHNVGLSHDGDNTSAYYDGHGSGPTGWAPIMGVGYYQPLVQWSKGEYANANNREDDFVVMQNNGLPFRSDDHGNTRAAASAMTVTGTAGSSTVYSNAGVIHRRADIDYFSFQTGVGQGSISVALDSLSPNLDVRLELRNSAGTVLATNNPAGALAASLTFNFTSPGTYYLTLDGRGKGNVGGTGYSDYASLGQYTVSATVPTP